MPYGVPAGINSNMNPSRSDPGYLAFSYSYASTWYAACSTDQYVQVNLYLRNLYFISKRRVAVVVSYDYSVSGNCGPYLTSTTNTTSIRFNGSGTNSLSRSVASGYTTYIADSTTDITSVTIILFSSGRNSNNAYTDLTHTITITPSYISSNNTNIVANTTSSLTSSTISSTNSAGNGQTTYNFKYVLLPETPNTNQIMNIKTQGMGMYFCTTDGKTLDRAASGYQFTISGIDTNGNTISNQIVNGFIMHPWGALTTSYSTIGSSNFSWLLHSYYNGDPVEGVNCARGTGNGTFFNFNTISNAPIVEATISGANKTLRLPSPATAGQLLTIIYKLSGSPTNFLHIDPSGNNLDGSTQTIYIRPSGGNQNAAVRLVSANGAWYILDVFNCLNWNVINAQTGQTTRTVSTSAGIVCITSAPTSGSYATVNVDLTTSSTTGQIHYIKDTLTTTYSASLVINSANAGVCGVSDRYSGYNATGRNRSALIIATVNGSKYPVGFYQGY